MHTKDDRISDAVLAEQWFSFLHKLIANLQKTYRHVNEQKGINQKKIADRLGKKPSYISRCLSGQQNMTVQTIHDLARAMDYRIEISFKPLDSLIPSNYKVEKEEPKSIWLSFSSSEPSVETQIELVTS